MSGLIRFRWIAIIFLMLGIVPLLKWDYLHRQDIPYFIGVLALLGVFNALSQGTVRSEDSTKQSKILAHLWVDLLAAAGLLFVSGSANNPFINILCVHAFLGGMLLRGVPSYLFGGSVLFLLELLQYETFLDEQITLGANNSHLFLNYLSQWMLVSVSWFVSHYFSKILHFNEVRIRELQARQYQSDRLKALGALTAGFSHQLATPLNSLKLRMERGLRKFNNETSAATREEFVKAQESLDGCVQVFQDMASVFSRSTDSELQKVQFQNLVKELLQAWIKEHGDVLVESYFIEGTSWCRLHVLAFSQAFFDFLDNAAEASPQNKPVVIRVFKKDAWIVLEVHDQGQGVSQEILSRLGEPFTTNKVDGNGLGIYSAMLMAQAAGGEFKLSNHPTGPGAIAKLMLPSEDE